MLNKQFNFQTSVTRNFILVLPLVVGSIVFPTSAHANDVALIQPPAVTHNLVAEESQHLTVSVNAAVPDLERSSYSATTMQEIDDKHAAAKAAEDERIRKEAEEAQKRSSSSKDAAQKLRYNVASTSVGAVKFPLPYVNYVGDGFRSRGGAHEGVDLLVDGGTPIFAAADGVVRVAQESYGGYGVAVVIDSVVDGQKISTTYGHMQYGSRVVEAGDTVTAGEMIGLVGSTGRSTANHLHFEVRINGTLVDPMDWLAAHGQ